MDKTSNLSPNNHIGEGLTHEYIQRIWLQRYIGFVGLTCLNRLLRQQEVIPLKDLLALHCQ